MICLPMFRHGTNNRVISISPRRLRNNLSTTNQCPIEAASSKAVQISCFSTIYTKTERNLPCQVVNSATDTVGRDSNLPHTDKRKSVSQAKKGHGYANNAPQSGTLLSKRRSSKRKVETRMDGLSPVPWKSRNWKPTTL